MVKATDGSKSLSKAKREQLASMVFDHSKNAMLITDKNHKIILVNARFTEITQYTFEDVVGKDPKIIKSGRHDRNFYRNLWNALANKGFWQGTIWNRRKNGEIYPEWQTIHIVRDSDGNIINYFAIFSDITETASLSEQVAVLKNYDPLTMLPNKALFTDRTNFAIANIHGEDSEYLAVMLLNIDNFKKINNVYGMPVGDKVLITAAKRIGNVLRKNITLSRLAGDNFLILLPEIKSEEEILSIAKGVINTFNSAFRVDHKRIHLSASIGIATTNNSNYYADQLIKQADLAMEKAKKDSNNNIAFFDSSMDTNIKQTLETETELYNAIENNEFVLYYQPQVCAQTGEIIGVEALIRWQHPTKGLLLPGAFLEVATDNGLIVPIGNWVLKEACRQGARWQQLMVPNFALAVNISALQVRQNTFYEGAENIIRASKINPEHLEIEITEETLIGNLEACGNILRAFENAGVRIALDDFGTGYSSLSYLQKFPIHKLKVDISFVRDMMTNSNTAKITKSIIAMTKILGIKSIAEGVETKEQFELLCSFGCDEIQGFYFSQAIPAEEITMLLKNKHRYKVV